MKLINDINQVVQEYGLWYVLGVLKWSYLGILFIVWCAFLPLHYPIDKEISVKKVLKNTGVDLLIALYATISLFWVMEYLNNFLVAFMPAIPVVVILFIKVWQSRKRIEDICKKIMGKDFWS